MRYTRKSLLVIVVLIALVACGGTPESIGNQVPTNPAATAPAASKPPSASTGPTASAAIPTVGPRPATASAPPVAAPAPSSAPAPSTSSATKPQPNGPIPVGWKVYYGPRAFPIVIAYPPDWRVDESLYPDQLIIFIVGPHDGENEEERIDIEPAYNGDGANIDVQRDEYFYRKTEFCDQKGIEYIERRQISGAAFAILGATCDQSNVLYFLQVASGVTGGDAEALFEDRELGELHRDDGRDVVRKKIEGTPRAGPDVRGQVHPAVDGPGAKLGRLVEDSPDDRPEGRMVEELPAPADVLDVEAAERERRRPDPLAEVGRGGRLRRGGRPPGDPPLGRGGERGFRQVGLHRRFAPQPAAFGVFHGRITPDVLIRT